MHFVEAKSILTSSAGYPGLNVYRGCAHGCIYCDSRSECYGMTHPYKLARRQRRTPIEALEEWDLIKPEDYKLFEE